MEQLLILASPFLLNGVVGAFKWAAGKLSTTSKRVILAGLAIVGSLAYGEITGHPVDVDSISSMWGIIMDAGVAFLMSHATYTLFFNKKK